MAATTRSKELILFLIIFTIIYTIITIGFSFIIMAWSWGEKLNIFQKIILFILGKPFRPQNSLLYIPLNGIIWGVILQVFFIIIKRLRK